MAEGNKLSDDLLSSGKVVAEAAMSAFEQKSVDNIDKKEIAGAAAGIINAGSTYGKLNDKPAGQYLAKAEGYLKEFSSGSDKAKADAPTPPTDEPKPAAEEAALKEPAPAPAAEEGKKSEGFGLHDIVKGAESLVEKQGGGEEGTVGGGASGGLFEMAQGFIK